VIIVYAQPRKGNAGSNPPSPLMAEIPLYRTDMAVFFMSKPHTTQQLALASLPLTDVYTDFILSWQAMNCTPVTMSFYKFTAGKFLEWVESQSITNPEQITARHVRQFIAELMSRSLQDTTIHDYARAIRTLLRFWYAEGYISAPVKFDMPK
jgi:hypothetical protein